jgi:hypothetical protein
MWSNQVRQHFENRPDATDEDETSDRISEDLINGGFSSFCNELESSNLRAKILTKENGIYRIDSSVFTNCDPTDFFIEVLGLDVTGVWLEEMDSYVLSGAHEGTENFDIFKMPTLGGLSFYYLDPHFSVIDCTGYRTINSLLAKTFDFEEYKAIELLLASRDPDTPVKDILISAADYSKMTYYRDLMDWGTHFHLFNRKSPFESIKGASINFSHEETEAFLDRYYPLDSHIRSSVS